jgi:predicted RecB family nuclease
MSLPEGLVFSQSGLQDYSDCPRRFELRYLLRQRWPAPEVDEQLAYERQMQQGERFHHLVHQHLVGIPAQTLLKRISDDTLRRWFEVYLKSGLNGVPAQRYPEVSLTAYLGAFTLVAKFDLLALESGGRALIVDWKTGRLPRAEALLNRLQTTVYRCVLALAGPDFLGAPLPPEQIEMVYWYADHDGAARRFSYNAAQFAADQARLLALLEEIATRRDFPLIADTTRCRFCPYRSLCDRGEAAGSLAAWGEETETETDAFETDHFTFDFDQIGEIAF